MDYYTYLDLLSCLIFIVPIPLFFLQFLLMAFDGLIHHSSITPSASPLVWRVYFSSFSDYLNWLA